MLATCGADGRVRLWDTFAPTASGKSAFELTPLKSYSHAVGRGDDAAELALSEIVPRTPMASEADGGADASDDGGLARNMRVLPGGGGGAGALGAGAHAKVAVWDRRGHTLLLGTSTDAVLEVELEAHDKGAGGAAGARRNQPAPAKRFGGVTMVAGGHFAPVDALATHPTRAEFLTAGARDPAARAGPALSLIHI